MKNPNNHHFSNENDGDASSSSDSTERPIQSVPGISKLGFLIGKREQEQAFHQANRHDKKVKEDKSADEGDEDKDATTGTTSKTAPRRKYVARSLKDIFKANSVTSRIGAEKPISATQTAEVETEAIKDTPESSLEAPTKSVDQYLPEDPHASNDQDTPSPSLPESDLPPVPEPPDREQPPAVPPLPPVPPTGGAYGGGSAGNTPPVPPSVAHNTSSAADYMPWTAANSTNNRVPSVVERRGGIAGPVTAFLAANYLSRRRHRRTKKETKKIRKEVEDTQTQQKVEGRRLRSIEDSIRNRPNTNQALPPQPQPQSVPEARLAAPMLPHESRPVKVSEVLAAAPLVQNIAPKQILPAEKHQTPITTIQLQPQSIEKPKLEQPKGLKPEEALRPTTTSEYADAHKRAIELGELRRKQAEQIHLKQVAAEEEQAKKAASKPKNSLQQEVKEPKSAPLDLGVPRSTPSPRPAVRPATAAPATTSVPSQSYSAPSSAQRLLTTTPPQLTGASQHNELYKRSMRNGSLVGLAVIILGTLAYFIVG